ncbi:auxin-induced protein 6B-like [Dorcoceras hygrometricum]|uniref:Auxin-induced protein 6B-like n=1 Tax=Dorcoceras hygrometricum TaxID=472368 RepID=A0A2Z7CKH6_9LAMI|nr:auxin-induced protein 6B-like [Dorcoceras hygrometricum]
MENIMQDNKKMKVKKGWLAVRVGLEDEEFQRVTIPISYLYHPLFTRLLEKAHDTYGYDASGPLKLPCSVDDFHHLRWRIEKESRNSQRDFHHHHHHGGGYFQGALSFHSC